MGLLGGALAQLGPICYMPIASATFTCCVFIWVYLLYGQLGRQAALLLAEELGTNTDSALTVESMRFMQRHILIVYPAFPIAVTLAAVGMISSLQLELFVLIGQLLGTVGTRKLNQLQIRIIWSFIGDVCCHASQ